MAALNSRQFPGVYADLGVDLSKLGCIMLDLDPISVTSLVSDGEDDLFFSNDPQYPYAQGAVAEQVAHLTLLYGLMESGPNWQSQVDAVLEGWAPEPVVIDSIGYFPPSDPREDYWVIVGHVQPTDNLIEGHQRLQLLPHIDTFPEYRPHVTLAYIKGGIARRGKWLHSLQVAISASSLPVSGINYGGR